MIKINNYNTVMITKKKVNKKNNDNYEIAYRFLAKSEFCISHSHPERKPRAKK